MNSYRMNGFNSPKVCKKLPGFLRVAFADPLPEKGYARRGWVTFNSEVNIKDMCAKLAVTKVSGLFMASREGLLLYINRSVCWFLLVPYDIVVM